MVESEKVEDAVDEQPGQALARADASLLRFGDGRVHGDDHVAQQLGGNVREITFAHGEGEDVGGMIPAAIVPVEFMDALIVNEQDGQFAFRTVQVV